MPILPRATRGFTLRPILYPSTIHTYRFYAKDSSSSSPEEGSGVQKIAEKGAKPKILEHAPPAEETPDVKKHNEDFQKRPDRAANVINDDNKVGKGFWTGRLDFSPQHFILREFVLIVFQVKVALIKIHDNITVGVRALWKSIVLQTVLYEYGKYLLSLLVERLGMAS